MQYLYQIPDYKTYWQNVQPVIIFDTKTITVLSLIYTTVTVPAKY